MGVSNAPHALQKDIFSELQEEFLCPFISDLRKLPYRDKALSALAAMNLEGYSPANLSDLAAYLTDETPAFSTCQEAQLFFSSKL